MWRGRLRALVEDGSLRSSELRDGGREKGIEGCREVHGGFDQLQRGWEALEVSAKDFV